MHTRGMTGLPANDFRASRQKHSMWIDYICTGQIPKALPTCIPLTLAGRLFVVRENHQIKASAGGATRDRTTQTDCYALAAKGAVFCSLFFIPILACPSCPHSLPLSVLVKRHGLQ